MPWEPNQPSTFGESLDRMDKDFDIDEVLNLVDDLSDALQWDNERGAHWLNNQYADELAQTWPRTMTALSKLFAWRKTFITDEDSI